MNILRNTLTYTTEERLIVLYRELFAGSVPVFSPKEALADRRRLSELAHLLGQLNPKDRTKILYNLYLEIVMQ